MKQSSDTDVTGWMVSTDNYPSARGMSHHVTAVIAGSVLFTCRRVTRSAILRHYRDCDVKCPICRDSVGSGS